MVRQHAQDYEPLISADWKQNRHSAVVDHRWTNVVGDRLLKLVLWYDNEWGYSSRVIDQICYVDRAIRDTQSPKRRDPLPSTATFSSNSL